MAEKPAVPECWQLVYPQHLFLPFFLLPHVRRLIFGPVNVCPATPPTILALFVLTFPKRCLTGFVFTVIIVECCACLGSVFLFSTSEQTGLTSHVLTRRTQLM